MLDYHLPDGDVFDEQTIRAVFDFQSQHGIPGYGVVGRETWMALNTALSKLKPTPARRPKTWRPSPR